MKRISIFLGISLMVVSSLHAQDIFKKHGFDKEMLTLSKGKYKEVFTNDEVVQIGTVLLNTKNNEIIKFLDEENPDITYKEEYSSRFLTMDPLAEKFPWQSPYVYCSNNPVNRIDPNGKADFAVTNRFLFWTTTKIVGNDGVDDGRLLILKTTKTSYGEGEHQVDGARLSKSDLKATVNFIKQNSGNTEAFQNNGMAYTNSIAIEGSANNRQTMVDVVGADNGKGGTADAN